MPFYPAKGGGGNLMLCTTYSISMSIPCNGDTVINVKDYDKDAKIATGITITVPAVSGSTWGGSGTFVKYSSTANAGNGQPGSVTFDGVNIHIKQIPSVGSTGLTNKIKCTLRINYIK